MPMTNIQFFGVVLGLMGLSLALSALIAAKVNDAMELSQERAYRRHAHRTTPAEAP